MKKKLLLNGFGRMGKLALRAAFEDESFEIVHINDPAGDAEAAAVLLKYDSVHGKWNKEVKALDSKTLVVEGKKISWSQHKDIKGLPLRDLEIDMVLDASGKNKTEEDLSKYFEFGVKKVVASTPVKDTSVPNIVMGINDDIYEAEKHHIISSASCTTNALAPIVKVLKEKIGIKHGTVTTIHDVTNTQTIIDGFHKDLRRARSSSTSLIPTTSGSSKAIVRIFPELEGRLESMAVRVPIQNSSIVDCVFEVERETTREEINSFFEEASNGELSHVLGYETLPLVSVDYQGEEKSSVIDALSTSVVNKTQIKVIGWYDNEWGYVKRMVELTSKVAKSF